MGHQEETFEAPWRGCLSYHNWYFLPSSSIDYKSRSDSLLCFVPSFPLLFDMLVSSQADVKRSKQSHPHFMYSLEHILGQKLDIVQSRPQLCLHVHHLPSRSLQDV